MKTVDYICPCCNKISENVKIRVGMMFICGKCGNKERIRNKMSELLIIDTFLAVLSTIGIVCEHFLLPAISIIILIIFTARRLREYRKFRNETLEIIKTDSS